MGRRGPTKHLHGRGRGLSRSRRAVLEGLPLTILVSVIVIAVGSIVLLGIYEYAQGMNLGSVTLANAAGGNPGYLTGTPSRLVVTAWASNGGVLGHVSIVLNGTGISQRGSTTTNNGTAIFWIVPVFHNHATSGILSVVATYSPGVSLVSQPTQTYSTTVPVLA